MKTIIELLPASASPKTGEIKVFALLDNKNFPSKEIDNQPIECAKQLFESIFKTTAEWPRFSLISADMVDDSVVITYSVMIPEDIMSFDKELYKWFSLKEFEEEQLDKIRRSVRF
jgi:hypothetical protein